MTKTTIYQRLVKPLAGTVKHRFSIRGEHVDLVARTRYINLLVIGWSGLFTVADTVPYMAHTYRVPGDGNPLAQDDLPGRRPSC